MSDEPSALCIGPVARRLEQAAERADAQPALAGLVGWLRSQLPGQDLAVDPLAIGPGLATDLAVRLAPVAAHRPSVMRELGLSALQLWQAQQAPSRPDLEPDELTILFTDIEGFSEWTLEVGDSVAVAALKNVAEVVEPIVAAEGTLVKRLGDGLMAVFVDPDDALRAAFASRDAVAALDPELLGGHRLRQRAGVHRGRPHLVGGDYLGLDVNVAARVADAAGGGEVCVSDVLKRSLATDWTFTERPPGYTRKGMPADMSVYVAA